MRLIRRAYREEKVMARTVVRGLWWMLFNGTSIVLKLLLYFLENILDVSYFDSEFIRTI